MGYIKGKWVLIKYTVLKPLFPESNKKEMHPFPEDDMQEYSLYSRHCNEQIHVWTC